MTATAPPTRLQPASHPHNPLESLEEAHYQLAQEITRTMDTSHTLAPSLPPLPSLPSPPPLLLLQSLPPPTPTLIPPRTPPQPPPQPPPPPPPPLPLSTPALLIPRPPTTAHINSPSQREVCAASSSLSSGSASTAVAAVSPKALLRAPVAKPSPAEEELVRRIHRMVGGPAKLSTYDDPAKVRHVVIEALAQEQGNATDVVRIRKGQLSVFERRVVRTVTNRGAAVRSRMRQRKEVAQLKNELRARDGKVRRLEEVVRALCSTYAVPLPTFLGKAEGDVETEAKSESMGSPEGKGHVVGGVDAPDFALDQELFGNLVDQMISHHPTWC